MVREIVDLSSGGTLLQQMAATLPDWQTILCSFELKLMVIRIHGTFLPYRSSHMDSAMGWIHNSPTPRTQTDSAYPLWMAAIYILHT